MPSIRVDVIGNVLTSAKKEQGMGELAEPLALIDEQQPDHWASIEEICNGEWSIGGRC
ncbi:MAG TPA: hypothetical protein VMT53_28065 [Terriglobales bacterium]|nr:hypothetical protein [Terriglobales bacterium]